MKKLFKSLFALSFIFYASVAFGQQETDEFIFINTPPLIVDSPSGGKIITTNRSAIQYSNTEDPMFTAAPGPTKHSCEGYKGWLGGVYHVICGPPISFYQDVSGQVVIECGDYSLQLCVIAVRN